VLQQHHQNASERALQKKLAEQVTLFVHGEAALAVALETTAKLFANQKAPADSLSEEDLGSIEGIVRSNYDAGKIKEGVDILVFLTETAIFDSKGAARKMLQNGGISINRVKITDVQMQVTAEQLLHDKYILVQVGKKNYFLVTIS
jgi:tyrosyl-tRNA synthetase